MSQQTSIDAEAIIDKLSIYFKISKNFVIFLMTINYAYLPTNTHR